MSLAVNRQPGSVKLRVSPRSSGERIGFLTRADCSHGPPLRRAASALQLWPSAERVEGGMVRDTGVVPMREDCRHFESRTYPSGEAARFCVLDLAPEAPWHCPENCPAYERSVIDSTFETAELSRPPVEDEPEGSLDDIEAVLADAEAIVEEAEPGAIRAVEEGEGTGGKRGWWRFGRRRPDEGDDFRLSDR